MEEYDVEELRRRRPLNIFSMVLAVGFVIFFLYLYFN